MESFVHAMDRAGERGYGWTKGFVHKLHLKNPEHVKQYQQHVPALNFKGLN